MPPFVPLETIGLNGLQPAPSQVWGAIRIVPLLREDISDDLQLARRSYGKSLGIVDLGGRPGGHAARAAIRRAK